MRNVDMDLMVCVVGFIVFFIILFGALVYSDTLSIECKKAAIEKGMAAVEIQAVCGR